MYKSVFNLPCACSLMRNGNNVPFGNFKGRGKRIHLYAFFEQDSEIASTKKHPYLQIEPSSSSDNLFRCGLYQVLKFNQTLISEGKITIEIVEGEEQVNMQVTDISLKKSITQKKMAYLILSDSTPQSLAILVKKVHDLILAFANKSKVTQQTQQNSTQPKEVKQVISQKTIPFQKEKPKESLNKPNNNNNNLNLFKSEKSSNLRENKVELNSSGSKKPEIEQNKQVILKIDQEEGSTEELDRKGSDEVQVVSQKQQQPQKIQAKLDFSKQSKQKNPINIINVDSQQSQEEQTIKGIDASKEVIDTPQTQEKQRKVETEKEASEEHKITRVELQIRNLHFETALKPKQQNNTIIQIDTQEQSGEISSCLSPKKTDLANSHIKSNEIIPEICEKEHTQSIIKDFEKSSKKVHFGNIQIHKKDKSNSNDSNNGLADNNEQSSTEKAKYFMQIEGTESQYEREQRTMQTETEKSQVINTVKFSSLQSKIEEIKGKKKKEVLVRQQQEEKSKQLYKVDRSLLRNQSPLQAMKAAKSAGIKRRNPFSCESDSGGHVEEDVDEEFEEGKLNEDGKQNSSEEEQLVYKANPQQVKKQISQSIPSRLEFKETKDLNDKPMKKLGSRFIFQKNSFNLQKTPAVVDLSTPQSKVLEESSGNKKGKNTENTLLSNGKELLFSIPEFVMGNILQFLEKRELFSVRTVSKFFNSAVFFSIRRLEFSKPSTPNERVIDMLSKAKYLQAVKFGRLAHVTPSDLLDNWVSKISTTLLTFECSAYTQLTEKLLVGILKASPNITTLILPFFGKITDNSLVLLSTLSKKLTHFKLESSTESFQRNDKISDAALARVVSENHCLISFSVFTISPTFFEKLKALEVDKQKMYSQREAKMNSNELCNNNTPYRKNQDAYARIQILKIHNLVLTRNAEESINTREEQITNLKAFSRLNELKIVNILGKAKGDWFLPYTPQLSIITDIFSSLTNLRSLCVGEWCTNEVIEKISENLSCLQKIRIIGSAVNDSGLEMIFQKMDTLQKVNIVDATRINGHCFESVISRNLSQIKVQFDDYRLNCLQSTITDDLNLPNATILNFKK